MLVLIADSSKAVSLEEPTATAQTAVENGKIAYVRKGDIYVTNADGSGTQRLTHTVGGELSYLVSRRQADSVLECSSLQW